MPRKTDPVTEYKSEQQEIREWAIARGFRVDQDGGVDEGHVEAYHAEKARNEATRTP